MNSDTRHDALWILTQILEHGGIFLEKNLKYDLNNRKQFYIEKHRVWEHNRSTYKHAEVIYTEMYKNFKGY